jgi:hypothetical protein
VGKETEWKQSWRSQRHRLKASAFQALLARLEVPLAREITSRTDRAPSKPALETHSTNRLRGATASLAPIMMNVFFVFAEVGSSLLELGAVLFDLGFVSLDLGLAGMVLSVSSQFLLVLLILLFLLLEFLLVLLDILLIVIDIAVLGRPLSARRSGCGLGKGQRAKGQRCC